jgi:hypothetical protein
MFHDATEIALNAGSDRVAVQRAFCRLKKKMKEPVTVDRFPGYTLVQKGFTAWARISIKTSCRARFT